MHSNSLTCLDSRSHPHISPSSHRTVPFTPWHPSFVLTYPCFLVRPYPVLPPLELMQRSQHTWKQNALRHRVSLRPAFDAATSRAAELLQPFGPVPRYSATPRAHTFVPCAGLSTPHVPVHIYTNILQQRHTSRKCGVVLVVGFTGIFSYISIFQSDVSPENFS